MLRLIEIGWACGGALASKVTLPARNRVISSVRLLEMEEKELWLNKYQLVLLGRVGMLI